MRKHNKISPEQRNKLKSILDAFIPYDTISEQEKIEFEKLVEEAKKKTGSKTKISTITTK